MLSLNVRTPVHENNHTSHRVQDPSLIRIISQHLFPDTPTLMCAGYAVRCIYPEVKCNSNQYFFKTVSLVTHHCHCWHSVTVDQSNPILLYIVSCNLLQPRFHLVGL